MLANLSQTLYPRRRLSLTGLDLQPCQKSRNQLLFISAWLQRLFMGGFLIYDARHHFRWYIDSWNLLITFTFLGGNHPLRIIKIPEIRKAFIVLLFYHMLDQRTFFKYVMYLPLFSFYYWPQTTVYRNGKHYLPSCLNIRKVSGKTKTQKFFLQEETVQELFYSFLVFSLSYFGKEDFQILHLSNSVLRYFMIFMKNQFSTISSFSKGKNFLVLSEEIDFPFHCTKKYQRVSKILCLPPVISDFYGIPNMS